MHEGLLSLASRCGEGRLEVGKEGWFSPRFGVVLIRSAGLSRARRTAYLERLYRRYLVDQDAATFIRDVAERYTVGTLERLTAAPRRQCRRAAVLALGFLGGYESNAVMGAALRDADRGVRIAAETGIVSLWCRQGNTALRESLAIVIRLNTSEQFAEAARRADELIEQTPDLAEAWNQRAIAHYSQGEYADSIHDCREAMRRNPFHFGAAAGLAQCYVQLGDYQSALECFRQALYINPNLEGVRANILHLERVLERES